MSLSQPRAEVSATTVGDRAFFAGGLKDPGSVIAGPPLFSDVVDIFDTTTGQWSTAQLSVDRVTSATTAGPRALFAGGEVCTSVVQCTPQSLVDVYDDTIGTTYCSPAVANSTGAPARLTVQGFPGTATQGYTRVTAANLPLQAIGFFVTSDTQGLVVGPGGSQGDLCLGGAIGRFVGPGQVLNSGSGGSFSLTLDLTRLARPTGLVPVQSGETWNFQAWYRDGPSSNFSDAVSVTFL